MFSPFTKNRNLISCILSIVSMLLSSLHSLIRYKDINYGLCLQWIFAILWNFQLQYYGILTCNFRYFYLTTNTLVEYSMDSTGFSIVNITSFCLFRLSNQST